MKRKWFTWILYVQTLFFVIYSKKMKSKNFSLKSSTTKRTDIPSNMNGKIVNGIQISIKNYPFLAQITFAGWQHCGGVIITHRIILTAGHCTLRPPAPKRFRFEVLLGSSHTGRGHKYSVSHLLTNTKFLTEEHDFMYDLGMMYVNKNIKLGPNVQIANLVNHKRWRNPNGAFIVAGYGNIRDSGAKSQKLRMARMYYVDPKVCNQSWAEGLMPVTKRNFCMIGVGFTSDCYGDSGSAVIWNGRYVVGLVTTGRSSDCGSDTVPSMYTDLTYYRRWLRKNMKKLKRRAEKK